MEEAFTRFSRRMRAQLTAVAARGGRNSVGVDVRETCSNVLAPRIAMNVAHPAADYGSSRSAAV